MATYEQQRRRLLDLVERAEHRYLEAQQFAQRQGRRAPVRHKCFVSYHAADIDGVTDFVEEFNDVFIPRVIGVSDSDHFEEPISSDDEDYIKQQIADRYLRDSSVTIVYVGRCTWARRYVDWEIAASVRNSPKNKRSGLMGITPPDLSNYGLPNRLAINYQKGDPTSYARYWKYPSSAKVLRTLIEDAFQARDQRAGAVKHGGPLRKRNDSCS